MTMLPFENLWQATTQFTQKQRWKCRLENNRPYHKDGKWQHYSNRARRRRRADVRAQALASLQAHLNHIYPDIVAVE